MEVRIRSGIGIRNSKQGKADSNACDSHRFPKVFFRTHSDTHNQTTILRNLLVIPVRLNQQRK
jgi:hypothetical protein